MTNSFKNKNLRQAKVDGIDGDQANHGYLPPSVMASAVDPSWVASHIRPTDHASSMANFSAQVENVDIRFGRKDRSIFDDPVSTAQWSEAKRWPMDSFEPSPFPPPWPSAELRAKMYTESAHSDPEGPLGPLASKWVADLVNWYERLQQHFKFDGSDLAANVRRNVHKWERRLQHLKKDNIELYEYLMDAIKVGHSIPFSTPPEKYFRKSNPPSLKRDKVRAWEAIKGDIAHGAIAPVDIEKDGIPWCVCPVRTADKSDGSARFVHNTRHVNKNVPKEEAECELETLLRTRNIFIKDGLLVGSDYSSGYHCLYVKKEHRKYLAFALHLSELTKEAADWLWRHHAAAYCHRKRCFIFQYLVLPFGLCTSCSLFDTLISALMGFWKRCKTAMTTTKVSSYIDDILSVILGFSAGMRLSIRMVFEAASLGLSLKIPKCSYFPRHAMVALGTVVDLTAFKFRVSKKRAAKIDVAIGKLQDKVRCDPLRVPAKLVASVIGLIWSISCCCHRAVSIMTRDMIAVLSRAMKTAVRFGKRPLKAIMAAVWSGTVRWDSAAQRVLNFWSRVNFIKLSAPISADVLGRSIELVFKYPAYVQHSDTSILFQDASGTASGGGILHLSGADLRPSEQIFLVMFDELEKEGSSTLREILGVLQCLRATKDSTKVKIIFACDNFQTVQAIKFGSRNQAIQYVAELIFQWCLAHNKICWPVWLPRTHRVIKEADRRSRLTIPHDERSPQEVVDHANAVAIRMWGKQISFDQAASHISAIRIGGRKLPFNAFCWQPEASGVDSFSQLDSWKNNVNYVFPPAPMTGRFVTFLRHTEAKIILALPLSRKNGWWSHAIVDGAEGLIHQSVKEGFLLSAFDFGRKQPPR